MSRQTGFTSTSTGRRTLRSVGALLLNRDGTTVWDPALLVSGPVKLLCTTARFTTSSTWLHLTARG